MTLPTLATAAALLAISPQEVFQPLLSGLIGGSVVVLFVRWGITSAAKDFVAVAVADRPAAVLAALQKQPGEFRKWNDEIYEKEFSRLAVAIGAVDDLRHDVREARLEVKAYADLATAAVEQVPQIARELTTVSATMERISVNMERMDSRHREMDRQVAALVGRSHGRSA